MSNAVLAFNEVRFAYFGKLVLDGIDLDVPAGKVIALMGPSGCGKSTLIALAAGLIEPSSGLVNRQCRRTAVMFQDPLLLPWRTALGNVAFALKSDRLAAAERSARARDMLASVGLAGNDIGKYPRQLSGGMRQRVALARALVVKPDLLLLDEPFSGLDTPLARQMLSLVRTLVEQGGMSALVVTHEPREAACFADAVHLLSSDPAHIVASRRLESRKTAGGEPAIAADAEALVADIERAGSS